MNTLYTCLSLLNGHIVRIDSNGLPHIVETKEYDMKKKMKSIITIALGLCLLFSAIGGVYATIGPVHIEMNITGERLGPARANTVTAFKIYMRVNEDIFSHDWIKIWFPIDEKSCDPADICGEGFEIKGAKESQRFVPNDAYFKTYTNEEEEDIGKIYEILDEHEVNTRFGECIECTEPEDNCRIVMDESGLGCWLMGTVLPAVPRDKSDRKERLTQIINSTSIGYSPCSECQGYPLIKQDCDERSYSVNSPVHVEAWRQGYNPIDINTSKATGILVPATPGRYKLRIAHGNEPTPVESDAFVLPCSMLENLSAELIPADLSIEAGMKLDFDVGEGGALDAGSSLIMIKFPPEFDLPRKIKKPRYIKVNGVPCKANPQIASQTNVLTIITSSNIDNLGHCTIEFDESCGITNPSVSSMYEFKVKTASEPEWISTNVFVGTKPSVTVTPPFAGTPSGWKAVGLLPAGTTISSGSEIAIIFPDGTELPRMINPDFITLNKKQYSGSVSVLGQEIRLITMDDSNGTLRIEISAEAGIINPPEGEYELKFRVGGDEGVFESFIIEPSVASVVNLSLSETQGYEQCEYKFTYIPSSKGNLSAGDTITVEFPESTIMPESIDPTKVTVGGKTVSDISIDGYKVTLTVDTDIPSITGREMIFTEDSGILTPRKAGTYKLIVSSDKDDPAESEGFGITQPKLETALTFKDPDEPDGCNGWYKTPPVLSLTCRNPDAEIWFAYDSDIDIPEKHIRYVGEKRLASGSQRPFIHYYSKFGDDKEEVKTVQLFLDTVAPAIDVKHPASKRVVTKESTFKINGERYFVEMLTDGQPTHQVADGVLIKVGDGEFIQVVEPEIFALEDRDSIQSEWEHEVNLEEGENTITVLGRDQACNEIKMVYTIVRDNTPPNIDVVSPEDGSSYKTYDYVNIRVKSESTASVFVNGSVTTVVEETEDGMAIFEGEVELGEGPMKVTIEAKDVAGNSTIKEMTLYAKNPVETVRLKLWPNSPKFVINNEQVDDLNPMPMTKGALPEDLWGNTYMPVRAILEALGATVEWIDAERRVDITLGDNFLQLWLRNDPKNDKMARLNGKDILVIGVAPEGQEPPVLYPTIVSGRAMLPLRFACEQIGADVNWIAVEEAIEIVYPSEK